MVRTFQQYLKGRIDAILKAKYGIAVDRLAIEQPPSVALGEFALPIAFELAKQLRKAPRAIAEELKAELAGLQGIAAIEAAGAGYLNVKLDRAAFVRGVVTEYKRVQADGASVLPHDTSYYLVEHTSINPNKAAHIGHLRNAILGDTFVRLLRGRGATVGVQNYVDNTGVQVADVVVGLMHLEGRNLESTHQLLKELAERKHRVDFYCWDLYARVSQWYGGSGADDRTAPEPGELARRKQIRLDTLHELEQGGNETSEIADLVSTAVLRRHLETMQRLGIEYDFLPRESEILSLRFWEAARALMLERGVLYLETEGKNKGCYVMRRAGSAEERAVEGSSLPDSAHGPDEDAKVIVRSNGTVTYVGKDIAYHLWKFGLLPGKDFGYARFQEYSTHTCWISTVGASDPAAPAFGRADAIYNVIDSRQNDPQNNVVAALRGMGFAEAAGHYTHFSYEMVAMTPRCAIELGYTLSEEDMARPFIEVSGRKGHGVKADDLIDRLIAAAQTEVDARHPELPKDERENIARQIAVGALRYFMLRFTRNTVIAFDFKDALSFEGETGPYIQYAVVRAANIFRKAGITEESALAAVAGLDLGMLATEDGTGLWEIWLLAARLSALIEQSIATAEPAHLARYAFQLAQQFNNFYHRFHILSESDPTRRALFLATAAVARREMVRALGYLGIEAPPVM